MDETKPTSAQASTSCERFAGTKRSVTRALTVVALPAVEAKEAVVAQKVRGPYKKRLAMLSGKPDLEE